MVQAEITNVKMVMGMYCLKKEIFDIYCTRTTYNFNSTPESQGSLPGAYLFPMASGGFATSTSSNPPAKAKIFTLSDPETRAPFSISEIQNINANELVEMFLGEVNPATTEDNRYWGIIKANEIDYVVPLDGNSSPLKFRVWIKIEYNTGGASYEHTAGMKDIYFNSINDYVFSDQRRLKMAQSGEIYNVDAYGVNAGILTQSAISGIKLIYRGFLGNAFEHRTLTDSTANTRYLKPRIKYTKDDISKYANIPMNIRTTCTPKNSYMEDDTEQLHYICNDELRDYYPHAHIEVQLERDGEETDSIPLNIDIPDTVKLALEARELESMGSIDQYSVKYFDMGEDLVYDNQNPVIGYFKTAYIFRARPHIDQKIILSVQAGGYPLTVSPASCHVSIPATSQSKVIKHYLYRENQWEEKESIATGDIVLRELNSGVADIVFEPGQSGSSIIIPLRLSNSTFNLGEIIEGYEDYTPVGIRVDFVIKYKVGESEWITRKTAGMIFLHMHNLISAELISFTQDVDNFRVINGISIQTKKILPGETLFRNSFDLENGYGYNMGKDEHSNLIKLSSSLLTTDAILKRTKLGWKRISDNNESLEEMFTLPTNGALTFDTEVQAGTKTISLYIPDDAGNIGNGGVEYKLVDIDLYLSDGGSVAVNFRYGMNTDDTVAIAPTVNLPQ